MKDKKKASAAKAVIMIVSVMVGGVLGALIGRYAKSLEPQKVGKMMIVLGCSVFAEILIEIVVHESGHLVMGLLTGYRFVSFRIGSLTWVKQDGRLALKRFSISGTAGQCIMMPPECDEPSDAPFVLYHLGGGLFNFLSALIALPIGAAVGNAYVRVVLFTLGAVSIVMGLMNLIPLNIQLPNDGCNIKMMIKSAAEREAVYKQLMINGMLYRGSLPSEIPDDLFDFGDEGGIHTVVAKILKGGCLIDKHDFTEAERVFAEVSELPDLVQIYSLEVQCELLFCKVMNGTPAEEIDALYDKDLRSYIKAAGKTQISKRRQMYAYYLLYKKDDTAAEKEYTAAMKMKDTYPAAGELKSELSLIEYVKELSIKNTLSIT